jgi:plastocyanin
MFSILYLAGLFASPSHAHFDKIPTEPKITQIQALEIIENDLRNKVPELQETKLSFQLYNFSALEYSAGGLNQYADYRHKLGYYAWPFSHVKGHPELLNMPLMFVHANGTMYRIDESAKTFEKVCEEPSPICPMGVTHTIAAKDRLVHRAELLWRPVTDDIPYSEGYYVIDAESGEIAWNTIDYHMSRKPMPNINFDSKTIRQLLEERVYPPEIAYVDIQRGTSDANSERTYVPKEIRVTLGIDNKIVWKNTDLVAHTVVSDNGYSNPYTGRFESELIEPEETFEYTFFESGEYHYHCDIHPWMLGTVYVVENFL